MGTQKNENELDLPQILRAHGLLADPPHQAEWLMVMGSDLTKFRAFFHSEGELVKVTMSHGVWRDKVPFEQHTLALEFAMRWLERQQAALRERR